MQIFQSLITRIRTILVKPAAIEERRHGLRVQDGHQTQLFVVVDGHNLGADARLLDVGDDGARVNCRAALPVGVTVACSLPFEGGTRDEWFRIVWRNRTAEGQIYGLQCVDGSREAMRQYVQSLDTRATLAA